MSDAEKLLELERGGTALVTALDGEHVTLLAPFASPPGSTLGAKFQGQSLSIKVRGSRRVEADASGRCFRVEGRFVSLSRALRLALTGQAPS
ncbi:MAG TPA: hypothetical protein VFV94_02350 [Polyangiaceae bacterium]|jgi:hypothetical protein|nr:hypothetical protein [Polyangiaceae bacterium]